MDTTFGMRAVSSSELGRLEHDVKATKMASICDLSPQLFACHDLGTPTKAAAKSLGRRNLTMRVNVWWSEALVPTDADAAAGKHF